jgi:hypothetical protein
MSTELSFERFFDLLRRRWRTFALVALMAVILSSIFSGERFITPKYRSSAIVYPVNLAPYSTETRTDQLLQLLESNSIRDSLVKKFDLVTALEDGHHRPRGALLPLQRVQGPGRHQQDALRERADRDRGRGSPARTRHGDGDAAPGRPARTPPPAGEERGSAGDRRTRAEARTDQARQRGSAPAHVARRERPAGL